MDGILLRNKPSQIFFWLVMTIFLGINIRGALPPKDEILVILKNPTLSHDLRLRLKLGSPLFEYIQFIQQEVPPEAVVVLPPQTNEFGRFGNVYFMQNYLYPRRLLYGQNEGGLPEEASHALVVRTNLDANGETNRIWPDNLDSYQVVYMPGNPNLGYIKLK